MKREIILKDIRLNVPEKPGCYLYKDKTGTIIYIGKAKNLLNRMSSYFNRVNNLKTTKLVSEIETYDYVITKNEKEALILENNLIKVNNPKYNILLKDDKRYPFILLTKEKHPKLLRVRDTKNPGKYFGPFPSGTFVIDIIEILNKEIPLRKCKTIPKEECIYYHIKQCYAPCIKDVSEEEINKYKDDLVKYLSGSYTKLAQLISNKMLQSAENLDFEKAQDYKLLLSQLEEFKSNQTVELAKDITLDVYSYKADDSWISISVISIIDGKVTNISNGITTNNGDIGDSIISYLFNHYTSNEVPEKFIIENEEIALLISQFFISESLNLHLQDYKNLIDLAKMNANEYYLKNVDNINKRILENKVDGFKKLQDITKNNLDIIEMYDISHTAGDAQVAAKIAFENGKKNTKLYRKYKIKEAAKADDYGSMREVIERRVLRIINGEEQCPNMIIVDGGKGQVSSALEILEKYNLDEKIILIGLVKDDKHTTRAMVNKRFEELPLKKNDALYKFFYKLQEEVHRFAIDFHRTVKTKSLFSSKLDNITGLGVKRKRMLISHFETVENIKNARVEDITKLSIPQKTAIEILDKLNS